jgi:hypothetical protein
MIMGSGAHHLTSQGNPRWRRLRAALGAVTLCCVAFVAVSWLLVRCSHEPGRPSVASSSPTTEATPESSTEPPAEPTSSAPASTELPASGRAAGVLMRLSGNGTLTSDTFVAQSHWTLHYTKDGCVAFVAMVFDEHTKMPVLTVTDGREDSTSGRSAGHAAGRLYVQVTSMTCISWTVEVTQP